MKRMKVLLVVCLIFLTKVWGKYYLVETEDKVPPHSYEAGLDYSTDYELEAETDKTDETDEIDDQGVVIKSINEVIDDASNGKEGNDYSLDKEELKKIEVGAENILKGINELKEWQKKYESSSNGSNKYKKPRKYGLKKYKKSRRCKKLKKCKRCKKFKRCKKDKESKELKG